jgi:hypothetical protein
MAGVWSPISYSGGTGLSPGQVMWDLWWTRFFFEYFGFPCQFSFHRLLYIYHLYHPGLAQ